MPARSKRAPTLAPTIAAHRVERKSLADLQPATYNPRRISKSARAGLESSLKRFGYVDLIVWNERTGVVVGGHQRLDVLRAGGVTEVDVVVVDLPEADEKALNVALNNPHIGGEFDETLADLLAEIRSADEMLFQELRLDQLLAEAERARTGLGDPDAVPEPPGTPQTQRGDLYELGAHRLLCGDSTDRDAWQRLKIGGNVAIVTSPPYGVGSANRLHGHHADGTPGRKTVYRIHKDDPQDWPRFMDAWTVHALEFAEVAFINVQILAANKQAVLAWIAKWAAHFVDLAIWDKGNAAPQMQANVLNNVFEMVVILARQENPSRGIPLGNFHAGQDNMIRVPVSSQGHNAGARHKAAFPAAFPEVILRDIIGKAEVVVDPFGGTGTTLIAAEMYQRSAILIEIDPSYCDVIVKRWEEFTGKKATRIRAR
jgi:DNA modification methylase